MYRRGYDHFENKMTDKKQKVIKGMRRFLRRHPSLKYPAVVVYIVYYTFFHVVLCLARGLWKVKGIIEHQSRKQMISILLCAGLAIIAMIGIIKIIRIHVAESEREQKILNLKESYVSDHTDEEPGTTEAVSIEEADAQESGNAPVSDASEAEDDPDAWYHDIEVDMESLREQNPDIIGWIYFENEETISYPILYSGDDYYLRRDYLGNDDIAGSIYVEGVNHPDLSDAHTLIYGHNMRNLSMFGNLRYYKMDENYYEDHRYFQIITEDAAYRYEIFAYKDVGTLTGGIYTVFRNVDNEFISFVKNTICAGSYVDADLEPDADTHILTLSTCSYDENIRFTVSAVRIDEYRRRY